MKKHFDIGSLLVIIITFILFTVALFTKGFTHDLLLEAGVLLVSIKLIIMAYKNSKTSEDISVELHEIKEMLSKNN
ncbi:MAG: hypothetical protein P8Y99_03485 [Calditrichaceae bacterium]|jgi:hypothetical protein